MISSGGENQTYSGTVLQERDSREGMSASGMRNPYAFMHAHTHTHHLRHLHISPMPPGPVLSSSQPSGSEAPVPTLHNKRFTIEQTKLLCCSRADL